MGYVRLVLGFVLLTPTYAEFFHSSEGGNLIHIFFPSFLPSLRSDVSEYLFLAGASRFKMKMLIDIHNHAAAKSTLFDQFVRSHHIFELEYMRDAML